MTFCLSLGQIYGEASDKHFISNQLLPSGRQRIPFGLFMPVPRVLASGWRPYMIGGGESSAWFSPSIPTEKLSEGRDLWRLSRLSSPFAYWSLRHWRRSQSCALASFHKRYKLGIRSFLFPVTQMWCRRVADLWKGLPCLPECIIGMHKGYTPIQESVLSCRLEKLIVEDYISGNSMLGVLVKHNYFPKLCS